ncbi:hypothetical protein HZC00_04770 [Candidatus Kaiserbacteria bacterium]|nr:hypothetical protein [Candidatus Kaiserbacteria bacterium]
MKQEEQEQAIVLRKKGHSLNEISTRLGVAKSSVSVWVKDVTLSTQAQRRIESRYTKGQLASMRTHRQMTTQKLEDAEQYADAILGNLHTDVPVDQIICAMLYWCEGSKMYANKGIFSFTNADPDLVATFLSLLRRSFDVDESKLRVCMHLHGYHDEARQLSFWSKTTSIPKEQFIRSYRKQETAITIRKGYQGCIQIRYYDTVLLRRILAIARGYMTKHTGL